MEKCEGGYCKGNEAIDPHECPTAEITGDYDTLCTCCDECIGGCSMEV